MTNQPAAKSERSPEERAAIERSGKRWAWIIGVSILILVIFAGTRDTSYEPTFEDKQADAKRACQEQFIADRLKAPATAKFSNVTVSGLDGTHTVTGSVDSQNSFGAQVRASFTCVVHASPDGKQWVLDSANVQG